MNSDNCTLDTIVLVTGHVNWLLVSYKGGLLPNNKFELISGE